MAPSSSISTEMTTTDPSNNTNEELQLHKTPLGSPPSRPHKSPAIPPSQEVRLLRQEVKVLNEQVSVLREKWKTALPDEHVRHVACEAAKQKTVTAHVEALNTQLKQQLLQQQLYFSSLQRRLTDAPLWSITRTAKEMFDRLHTQLILTEEDASDAQRIDKLQNRFTVGFRVLPTVMDAFTNEFIDTMSGLVPFSRTSVMAFDCYSLVSNVFMCKFPNVSLPQVYEAVVASYGSLHFEAKTRLGVMTNVEQVHSLTPNGYYCVVERKNGDFQGQVSHVAFMSELSNEEKALFVTDFVEQDVKYPFSPDQLRIEPCSGLMLTYVHDAETNQRCVLLRRLRVHRYNLPPHSSRLHREVNATISVINGDLYMELVCDRLKMLTG